jgi:hypothetical protein
METLEQVGVRESRSEVSFMTKWGGLQGLTSFGESPEAVLKGQPVAGW